MRRLVLGVTLVLVSSLWVNGSYVGGGGGGKGQKGIDDYLLMQFRCSVVKVFSRY